MFVKIELPSLYVIYVSFAFSCHTKKSLKYMCIAAELISINYYMRCRLFTKITILFIRFRANFCTTYIYLCNNTSSQYLRCFILSWVKFVP